MVLRENIDFKNINLNSFKSFKCLCELCDCGCFEKTKQLHSPECTRKPVAKPNLTSFSASNHSPKKCTLSHYKDTFKHVPNARPATTYVPPPDLFLYAPTGSIDFNTIQKLEFRPYEIQPVAKPFKINDNYELSNHPVSGVSSYIADYPPKENVQYPQRVRKNPNDLTMRLPVDSFSSKTTTNDHYLDWKNKKRVKSYSDHPSHAGESLFPTGERHFETSTHAVHHQMKLPNKTLLLNSSAKGSLTIDGDMEFNSAYRDNYPSYPSFELTKKIVPNQNEIMFNKGKFKPSITHNQKEFVFYPDHRPPKPANTNPFVSQIDHDLYPGDSYDHSTTQRIQFPGIDTTEFKKAKSCKQPEIGYVVPSEKVLGESVTMGEFKPIDFSQIPVLKAIKKPGTLKIPVGPMETQSMTQIQFLPYEVKPHVMARDLHPDYYCPPQTKFDSKTTNSETYQGKRAPRRLPIQNNFQSIDSKKGDLDFNTSYSNEFKNHGLTMCEAKAFLIAQSMADEKNQANPNVFLKV